MLKLHRYFFFFFLNTALHRREISDQHLGLVDFQASEEAGHEGLWWFFLLAEPLLRGFLLLHWRLWRGFVFGLVTVLLLTVIRTATTYSLLMTD